MLRMQTRRNIWIAPCQEKRSILVLITPLTMNYEGTSLTHILHAGMLNLNVQSGSDQEEAAISSIAPISIPYEMQGVMKDCSLEMQGTMMASASGYCEDGTVYLIITEDWQPASGQMICPDGAMPFQVPAAGPMIHEGADGNGEVFYLVEGSEGYTSMRPFQEGDGYHTWDTIHHPGRPRTPCPGKLNRIKLFTV